jgi:aspartate aminotransferase
VTGHENPAAPVITPDAQHVLQSGIREIVNMVIERPSLDVVRLEVGEPDFAAPAHVIEAAVEAAARGARYTPSAGIGELRAALSDRLERFNGVATPADRVIVTHGAVEGLAAVVFAVVAPGQEVLVPDPGWPNYEMQVTLRGGVPVRYPLTPDLGFVPDPDRLLGMITPQTALIVLNTPSNPTGAVFPPDVVEAIVIGAARVGVPVVVDEVYDELIYDGTPARAVTYDPEWVIGVYSFSKTYAMTGWRVGYVAAPTWLAPTLVKLQEPLLSCLPAPCQAAALAALRGPQDIVATMRETYRQRRDVVVDLLAAAEWPVRSPDGAFYLLVPLAPGVDGRAAAIDLVDHGVATAPGTAFGDVARDHLRVSLASSEADLRRGVERLVAWGEATERGTGLRTPTRA